jgi:hypothetical protein
MPRFKYTGNKVRIIDSLRVRPGQEFTTDAACFTDEKRCPSDVELIAEVTDTKPIKEATQEKVASRRKKTSIDTLPAPAPEGI